MISSLQALVEHIIKQIVNAPETVHITPSQTEDSYGIEIHVAEQDRGRVIGRNGQTIRSIRALIASIVPKNMRISVDLAK